MAQLLTYGFYKPETNDQGPDIFPLLEDNWQKVNDHTHNGVNSSKILGTAVTATTVLVSSAVFTAVPGKTGHYEAVITMPSGWEFEHTVIEFRHSITNHLLHLGVEYISTTQYRVKFSGDLVDIWVRYR